MVIKSPVRQIRSIIPTDVVVSFLFNNCASIGWFGLVIRLIPVRHSLLSNFFCCFLLLFHPFYCWWINGFITWKQSIFLISGWKEQVLLNPNIFYLDLFVVYLGFFKLQMRTKKVNWLLRRRFLWRSRGEHEVVFWLSNLIF